MEPDRQFEIQLGHMCNNRCVFCVSGQRTAQREAFPLEGGPIVEKLREGRSLGMRKVTLLGGEPTLQPEFMTVVREAVALGFEEVVIFTNGVKTAREAFVDEVLATGGSFTWRLSFQGATALAHERTTRKLGSFARLKETLEHLRRKRQKVTVNMCVVRSNAESVGAFPALVLPYGVVQLHLDMIRPLDAGVRTEDEMRAMLPRYSDLAPHLRTMIEGFERESPGFDVNIGNLPYCVAPDLAPWIHHDGETTFTVAVDAKDALSDAWDKYLVKRRDKLKPASCRACVFDAQCSGVFETYQRFYGTDELVPITPARLVQEDPTQRLFTLHVKPLVDGLSGWSPPAPFEGFTVYTDSRAGEVRLHFTGPRRVSVALRRGGRGSGGIAATDRFSLHALEGYDPGLSRALFARLCEGADATLLHPVTDEGARADWRIGQCLGRLRARAPFGELAWREVRVSGDGREASARFDTLDGNTVTVSFALKGERVAGGYRLARPVESPTPGLVASVREVMDALRGA